MYSVIQRTGASLRYFLIEGAIGRGICCAAWVPFFSFNISLSRIQWCISKVSCRISYIKQLIHYSARKPSTWRLRMGHFVTKKHFQQYLSCPMQITPKELFKRSPIRGGPKGTNINSDNFVDKMCFSAPGSPWLRFSLAHLFIHR